MKESLEDTIAALEAALPSTSRGLLSDFAAGADMQAAEVERLKGILARVVEICDRGIQLEPETAVMALRLIRDTAREASADQAAKPDKVAQEAAD